MANNSGEYADFADQRLQDMKNRIVDLEAKVDFLLEKYDKMLGIKVKIKARAKIDKS